MSEQDDHKVIMEKLEDIWTVLNGNGKTGLCAKVNLLWTGSIFIIGAIVLNFLRSFL